MPFAANPRDEEAAIKYEEEKAKRDKQALRGVNNPDLSNKIGAIHKQYPHITPGVALSLARANASEQTIKSVADAEAKRLVEQGNKDKNAPSGPLGRIGEWAKSGTRWASAALAFPYQAGVNVASQVFSGGAEGIFDGFVISTDLGTMIKDDEKAGSGFFMGGDAAKNQAERARRYRGTIGGQAWTIGRGAASLVAEPGSQAYNILSGLVDAAAVIGGDPLNYAVPGVSRIGAAQKGLTALGPKGKIMPLADDVVDVITGGEKIVGDAAEAAGALHVTARSVDPAKAKNWLESAQGRRVTEVLAGTQDLASTRKVLPNLSTRLQLELTDAKTVDEVRSILAPRLGIETGLIKPSDIKYKSIFSGNPAVSERSRVTKLFDKMPSRAISLRPGDRNIDEAVENVDRWLRSTGYSEAERAPVIEEFARAFTGVMDPEKKAERIARLQGAAEEALDTEHRAAFQDLIRLQEDSAAIGSRAIAEGKAMSEVQRIRATYGKANPRQIRDSITSGEVYNGLKSVFMQAVDFMNAAGISLDDSYRPNAALMGGVRFRKGTNKGFDRFGRRISGSFDEVESGIKNMAEMRRRGWVRFGDSILDPGGGTYRGGTTKGLVAPDKAFGSYTGASGTALSEMRGGVDYTMTQFIDEFQRNADIIDTLRPLFGDPRKRRIPRQTYGDAAEMLRPLNLFADPMYNDISYEELVRAASDVEAAKVVQAKFLDNEIDLYIQEAVNGNLDEFVGFTKDEIYEMWGTAVAGVEPPTLQQARQLSALIEQSQVRLDEIEAKFKNVGLAPRGTARADMYQVAEKFRGMVKEGLVRSGVDEEIAEELLSSYYSNVSAQSLYAIDEAGKVTDFGFGKALLPNDAGELVPTDGVFASPGLRSEMLSRHLFLPDPRQVRRLQSRVGWVTGVRKSNPELAGELRLPAAMLEFIQQEVWRPLTLMTGGYVLRNIAEAQARMTLLSRTSIFKHPLQHLMWAAGWKGAGDVMGRAYQLDAPSRFLVRGAQREEVASLDDLIKASQEDYIQAMGNAHHKYGGDPINAQMMSVRSGVWGTAQKANRSEYLQGYVDELRQLYDDPIARMMAQGNSEEQVMNWLRTTEEGRRHWSEINEMFESGVRFVDDSGTVRTVQASMLDERNLRNYIRRYIGGRLDLKAGEFGKIPNEALRDVAAHSLVQNGDRVTVTQDDLKDLKVRFKSQTDGASGNIYVVKTETRKVRGRRQEVTIYGKFVGGDTLDGSGTLLLMEDAWDKNMNASPAFRRMMTGLLDDEQVSGLLPAFVKHEKRVRPGRLVRTQISDSGRRTFEGMDTVVGKFFGELFGRTTAYLDRSPLFRQRYWEQVETILPVVDGRSVATLRNRVIETSNRLGISPENYVGSKALWKKLSAVDPARTGRVNADQLDEYAKGHALDSVKNELYNATDRNNLTDVARVIAPFGQAWGEILKTWTGLVASDPRVLRRANVIVEGAKDADPDGDGRGFFYKDPVSGEYVFNYPLSDKLIGFLTGPLAGALNNVPVLNRFGSDAGSINATLTAPVKSLNMGFSVSPGLGPVAQIPAAIILRNVPGTDEVKEMLMPFGEPELRGATFVPAWLQKFLSGVWDKPDTSRIMGQTYVEVLQHLYASNEYNPSDINDRERMFEDAIGIARQMTVLRSFGQFLGPTRPTVEFVQKDAGGVEGYDLPVAFYAAELRRLQDIDYDTATSEFLKMFPDAVPYLGSKTKSAYGGLDITKEYGKWEEENGAVIKRYKDVGGFFGPYGSNVDLAVWSRQLSQGKRNRQKGREVIDEAEFNAGNAIFKKAAAAFPGQRTEQQRDALKALRVAIGKKYPGFATLQSYDTQKFGRQIAQLELAVADEQLAGNPVRDAVEQYLEVRAGVIDIAKSRGNGIGAKSNEDLRASLRAYGETLVKKYPDFVRLYDRVLAREVESDTDPNG